MKKYVDVEELLKHKRKMHGFDLSEAYWDEAVRCEDIRNAPIADVAEVRHGKWRVHDSDVGYVQFACSLCGELVTLDDEEQPYPYCPNCGARMDAERIEQ